MALRFRRRWWLAVPAVVLASLAVPPPDAPASGPVSLRVLDRNGELLHEARADGRARPVALEAMAPAVVAALVAVEDRHFYRHPGVNPLALLRAAVQNLRNGRVVSGGSTLTMQAARALRGQARRGGLDKLAEMHLAFRLEVHRSKAEILALWLNRVAFGNHTHGVEAAAQLYFGKSARDLVLAEAALLVGLPQRPSAYDPFRHPDRAIARQRRVLAAMVQTGALTTQARHQAEAFPLSWVAPAATWQAPHFTRLVATQAPAHASVLHTTLGAGLQRRVEALVQGHLATLGDASVSQAAVVVLENATGAIRAYVGSGDFWGADGQNDGVRQRRQPGSALKPFTYALALESGVYTAATLLPDVPMQIIEAGGAFAPENYDRQFHGPVSLRTALANSYNVPAVHVARRLGPAALLSAYRQAGFSTLDRAPTHYGVGLTLGNGEVTLLDVAAAYAGLARGGTRPLPYGITAIEWAGRGQQPVAPRGAVPMGFSAATAFVLTDVLSDAEARAPAFGRGGPLELPFPVAVKTGTTKDYRDNWTVGYTPTHTVAVWVGNFDNTPMRWVSGVSGAGPLFSAVMRELGAGGAFIPPQGMQRHTVCPASGVLPGTHCPLRADEWFAPGMAPPDTCAVHQRIAIDTRTNRLATADTPPGDRAEQVMAAYPPIYHAWMRERGWPVVPGAATGEAASTAPSGRLRVTFPVHGSVFHLDPVLRAEYQRLRLTGTADGAERVRWRVDGVALEGDWTEARWRLAPGTHRIELEGWDADGHPLSSRPVFITVRGAAADT